MKLLLNGMMNNFTLYTVIRHNRESLTYAGKPMDSQLNPLHGTENGKNNEKN